jgi:predicted nucleotidyltransferase
MLTTSNIETIIQLVTTRFPDVVGVYLFGSAAKGEMTPESDVDLALLNQCPLDPETAFQLKTDLSAYLKRDVDLIDLRRADDVTASQVVSTAETLFSSDDQQCAIFETAALSKFALLNEERCGILDDIKSKGTIYGR